VEEGAVGAGADLVDDVGLEIAVDGARHVLAVAYMRVLVLHLYSQTLRSTYQSRRRRSRSPGRH